MAVNLLFITILASSQMVYNFEQNSDLSNWYIVNDGVMGGLSQGEVYINDEGKGEFTGTVSLANNGGFTSIRYDSGVVKTEADNKLILRLKGDGKSYQIRIKASRYDGFSYIQTIDTSGEWQDIEVPLSSMYPSWRGQKLRRPNFNADSFEELGILVGNKREESFKLELDYIKVI